MKAKGGICPIHSTMRIIGGKWKIIILYLLMDDVHRFGELKRSIEGITQKMLTQQLRELEKDGIIERKVYPQVPPKVEYSLTKLGKTLEPVLDHMCQWGQKVM